jgi:hypothetical protein
MTHLLVMCSFEFSGAYPNIFLFLVLPLSIYCEKILLKNIHKEVYIPCSGKNDPTKNNPIQTSSCTLRKGIVP